MYPKIPLAQSILNLFLANGIQHIVISPGSRNAPLTIGFASNSNFTCYSVVDERCAAFFALGIAQQIQKPVAVVCTSGSALLNYYPAFAEAFYSQIPLIVVSADRPKNKIDIGDGQTIRQENVFENHSLFNANLTEDYCVENNLLIEKAIQIATNQNGPVHINAPFEEPLYQTVQNPTVANISIKIDTNGSEYLENYLPFVEKWNTADKKLILVGSMQPSTIEQKYLDFLANDSSVVVFTEVTSNLHHPNFITNIDTIITPFTDFDFTNFKPQILVTFGGMIVSKRIKTFLRNYQPEQHWHIDQTRAYDTFGCLSKHFKTNCNTFFENFLPQTKPNQSRYQLQLETIKQNRAKKHASFIETIPFSDLKVFEIIAKNIPTNTQIQISNSSAIRYAQLVTFQKNCTFFCNRGTSGIDGSTSTAIGAAVASTKPTVLITGDIGFFYDSNSLWNNYIPKNFKIIILNNGGGGIFRILPGHEETSVFNTFFETQHQLTAEHLAKMYQLDYLFANNEISLQNGLQTMLSQNNKPVILEISTPTTINNEVLLQYFKNLEDNI